MSAVVWSEFSDSWLNWFYRETEQHFIRRNVNGRCAYVADLYQKFLGYGENQYGFYLGKVTHPFWAGKTMIRHGWLKADGAIIDPTRWCFMDSDKPMLATAGVDSFDYDFGMNEIKSSVISRQPPEFNAEKRVKCNQPDIIKLLRGQICLDRLFWLSNLSPTSEVFNSQAQRKRAFKWIQASQYAAFVPVDNKV